MRIIINAFRCYCEAFEIDINEGSCTLLSGSSGQGKTTIFQALTWCLFGNIRNVNPKNNLKGRVSVTIIENENFKIYRQKAPGLLVVTVDRKEYQDDAAQAIINDRYVMPDLWPVVAYINQGDNNALLSKSASERMDILNTLAFNGDDPGIIIDKLDVAYSEIEKNMIIQQGLLKEKIGMFNEHNKEYKLNITVTREAKTSEIESEKAKLREMEKEKRKLDETFLQYQVVCRSNALLLEECTRLQYTLDKVPLPIEPLQEIIRKTVGELRQEEENIRFDPLYRELEQLEAKMTGMDCLSTIDDLVSIESRLQQAHNLQYLRDQSISIAKRYNILYDTTSIHNEITVLNSVLAIQEDLRLKKEIAKLQLSLSSIAVSHMDEVQLKNRLQQIQAEMIALQRDEQIKKDLFILQTQINTLPGDIPSLNQIEVEEKHLYTLQQAKDSLLCPHCSGSVRLQDKILVKCDHYSKEGNDVAINNCRDSITRMKVLYNKKALLERVTQLRSYLSNSKGNVSEYYQEGTKITQQLSLLQERKNIESQIARLQSLMKNPAVDGSPLDAIKIQLMQEKIHHLSTITIYPEQKDIIAHLQSTLTIHRDLHRIQEIKKLLPGIRVALPDANKVKQLQLLIKSTTQQLEQMQREHAEYHNSIKRMQELKQKIVTNSSDPTPHIKIMTESIEKSKRNIADGEQYINLYTEYIILQVKYEEVMALEKRLANIGRLRALAKDVECFKLEQIVNDLNNHVNDICSSLFPAPINVKIELYKTAKSTGRSKPNINLIIDYKGMQYDNINQLSGGEKDRISLALTLAMNKISGCSILLLDEVMSTFDGPLKDIAVKAIRHHTVGKTVMLICHSTVTGVFPHVLDLNG